MQQDTNKQNIGTLETSLGQTPGFEDAGAAPMQSASDEVTEEPDSLIGAVLSDRYKIEACLGVGGMGAVYQAEHVLMHKRVAVKVLHPEMTQMAEIVERFEREAMAAAHIDHPNVATATDFGKLDDGAFFLVLEYVDGRSLRDILDVTEVQPWRAVHIVEQVASALARAHGMGIVHRDLKPENIMLVERDGDPDFVKVLDFGIAKVPVSEIANDKGAQARALTRAGMVFGTPEYMAPEQALGQQVDARADIYSLGVISYEMLTGRLPFEAESPAVVLGMQVSQSPPRFDEVTPHLSVPVGLEALVMELLSKDAAGRPADAGVLLERLRDCRQQNGVSGGLLGVQGEQAMAASGAVALASPGQISAPAQVASVMKSRPLDRFRSHLPPALRGIPLGLLIGAPLAVLVTAGVIIVALAIVLVNSDGKTTKYDAGVWSTLNEPARAPDADLAGAKKKGPAALEALRKAYPKDERVLKALTLVYLTQEDGEQAAEVLRAGYKLTDAIAKDAAVKEAVFRSLKNKKMLSPMLAVMGHGLGSDGVDWLYDVAYSGKARSKSAAQEAKKMLLDESVLQRGSPALRVAMDLKRAKTCSAKKKLLPRAEEVGDGRTLKQLNRLTYRKGCGFLSLQDCWSCMRSGKELRNAIKTVTARVKKSGDQK